MAETFTPAALVVPGTYIKVQSEGLIGAGGVSTGTIGIVGTAQTGLGDAGTGDTHLFSSFSEVEPVIGPGDPLSAATLNLNRALDLVFRNGARVVFARTLPAGADQADFDAAFAELVKEDINIVIAPELDTATALAVLGPVLESAENDGEDLLAVIGSDEPARDDIEAQVPTNDRVVFTAPGLQAFDAATSEVVDLPGTYTAAAVAGLLSTLQPQASPTNKPLAGITALTQRFSRGEVASLLGARVCVLDQRGIGDVRVVRGLTTDDGGFTQISVRRIVDFAKAGIRKASDPFIGRLNNERVRKALRGAIDGFLTSMLVDEALTAYELSVTATRQDEINGRAVVTVLLQPTFSIDFVTVTLVLQ
jgi:hypothetical protein